MKLLLFGSNGQVGLKLQKYLAHLGNLKICNRNDVDFNNLGELQKIIRVFSPDIIINAAIYVMNTKLIKELNYNKYINMNDFITRMIKRKKILILCSVPNDQIGTLGTLRTA